MQKISTKELRRILNEYTGGSVFNKTEKEMRFYIRQNFFCSEYTISVLAKEFCKG